MTDTPTATVCDYDGCAALIPADIENRRTHRAGHRHDAKVIEALRTELKDVRTQLADMRLAMSEVRNEISGIEIPEQIEPLSILSADELEPLDDDDDQPVSTYANDTVSNTVDMGASYATHPVTMPDTQQLEDAVSGLYSPRPTIG